MMRKMKVDSASQRFNIYGPSRDRKGKGDGMATGHVVWKRVRVDPFVRNPTEYCSQDGRRKSEPIRLRLKSKLPGCLPPGHPFITAAMMPSIDIRFVLVLQKGLDSAAAFLLLAFGMV